MTTGFAWLLALDLTRQIKVLPCFTQVNLSPPDILVAPKVLQVAGFFAAIPISALANSNTEANPRMLA